MSHDHHVFFAALSLIVAVLGSWSALDLFGRVRSHVGRPRRMWLGLAGVAMGLSIWSMHFIAMLGFDPGSPVGYDLPLTFLSLALAIGATSGAFILASRQGAAVRTVLVAGFAMGLGICLMHYVGMAALRTAVSLGYRPPVVAASFLIAIVASTAALFAAAGERSIRWRAGASLLLGLAIVGMHYTAMAGLSLTPVADAHFAPPGAPPLILGISVAGGTATLLTLALLAAVYDQRLNVLSALEAGGVGYWELALREGRLDLSAVGKQLLGRDPEKPFSHADFLAMLRPEDRDRRALLLEDAIRSRSVYDAEFEIAVGSEPRWVNVRGRVVAGANGEARRMAGVILDVTDRRQAFKALDVADRRQQLMIAELNHRVKNTLATVQSIARQTAKRAPSVESFSHTFEARLVALSNAHSALTRGHWEQASLLELLQQEFSPYSPDQYVLTGDDVALKPRHGLALGMAFHELATNAAKYGAFSQSSGCVQVQWECDPGNDRLNLRWSEMGGPPVSSPERRGFGSRLIQSTMEDLAGSAAFEYAPGGLRCVMEIPL